MAAFHQRRSGPHPDQVTGRRLHRRERVDLGAGEQRCLLQVGRHQRGQRKEPARERGLGVGLEQAMAAGGNHYRVHHARAQLVGGDGLGDGFDQFGGRQHSGLEGAWMKIRGHRVDLRAHHRRRDGMDRGHAEGVLGGDGCHRRGTEHTEGVEGLEVRLDARAAAGIAPGYGERDR